MHQKHFRIYLICCLIYVVYAGYQISAWQTNMTRAWLGCWYHNLYFFKNIFNMGQRLKHELIHIAAIFYTERHWSAWIWLGKPILLNLLWIQLLWNQCIDSKVNQQHETWFLAPGVKLTQKLLPPESNYFRYIGNLYGSSLHGKEYRWNCEIWEMK